MKRICKTFFLILFISLAIGCSGGGGTEWVGPENLDGVFRKSPNGQPIPGAIIIANGTAADSLQDVTNADGMFSLSGVTGVSTLTAELPNNGQKFIYQLTGSQNIESDFIELFTSPVSGISRSGSIQIDPATQILGLSGPNYLPPNPPIRPLADIACDTIIGTSPPCEVLLSGVITASDQSKSVYVFMRSTTQDEGIRVLEPQLAFDQNGQWSQILNLRDQNGELPDYREIFEIGVLVTEVPLEHSLLFPDFESIPGAVSIASSQKVRADFFRVE